MKINCIIQVTCFSLILLAIGILIHGDMPLKMVIEGLLLRVQGQSQVWNPLLDERLPRLIILICTGASLAVAGMAMQALFQNPLASPGLLGITSGGGLFALIVFIFDLQSSYPFMLPMGTFLGCLLTLCLIYALAAWQYGMRLSNLILTGIAISTLFTAAQAVILYALKDNWQFLQTMLEWESGSTMDRTWQQVHMQMPLTLIGLFGCWYYRMELNILSLGEEEAKSLGVEVEQVRWRLFLCVALLVGGALAAIGAIAFIGLILPHIARCLVGVDHRRLLPLCAVGGAAMLALLDLSLRFFELYRVSIGNFSAIIGGCFFLYLLFQKQKTQVDYL